MEAEEEPKVQRNSNESNEVNKTLDSNFNAQILQSSNPLTGERLSWIICITVFITSIILLMLIYTTFPDIDPIEREGVKLPKNIEEAKILAHVLSRYKDEHYFKVLGGVVITYIFLQTFAIPGSIFLSIMSGFLFPFWTALGLICFCSATGASFCFLLSYAVGRRLVYKYFPQKAADWAQTVERQKENLLSYMIFLRITPFLPNWFINITAPVLNVPLPTFWLGTFFGVAPPSFLAIQAGTTLQALSSSTDAVSWQNLAGLIVLGALALLPILLKKRMKEKFS